MISDLLRKSSVGSISASVEGQMLFGTVEAVSPLRVRVDNRLLLEGEALVVPHFLERQEFHLVHEADVHTMDKTYLIEPGLQAGDRVILLSLAGEYLVLGRVGDVGNVRQVVEI